MRAVVIERFGGPEVLHIAQVPVPSPGPGQVRVKVAYAGVNPADWKDREGHTADFYDISFPYILGFDAAGAVDAVGAGVTDFGPGDRVFTTSNHGEGVDGSYAEYLLVSAANLAILPDELDLQSAAAVPVAALTAWQALLATDKGALQAGQSVLVHGASGGLGSFAVQFAKLRGARVAGTCSTANIDYLRGLGADLALDYSTDDLGAALTGWITDGLDLIVDAVGGGTLPGALELLREGGRLVSIATLVQDGDITGDAEKGRAMGREKIYAIMDNQTMREDLGEIGAHLAAGDVVMPPVEVCDMADVRAAHEKIQSGHVRGKLVLRIGGEQ
jgi:NADPH2:quinone reductase